MAGAYAFVLALSAVSALHIGKPQDEASYPPWHQSRDNSPDIAKKSGFDMSKLNVFQTEQFQGMKDTWALLKKSHFNQFEVMQNKELDRGSSSSYNPDAPPIYGQQHDLDGEGPRDLKVQQESSADLEEQVMDQEFEDKLIRQQALKASLEYADGKSRHKFASMMSGETGLEPQVAHTKHYRFLQEQGMTKEAVSPVMIVIVAAVVLAVMGMIALAMNKKPGNYQDFSKSGLSTSSSEITSSETGSTDRELKSRMERFEKRLEEHKKMLETKDPDGTSSITDSESQSRNSPSQGANPQWHARS